MSTDDPGVATALFAWEEGLRRLDAGGADAAARERVVSAVLEELRRRVGSSFLLADLARVYEDASDWYLELAARVAPREREAWDPSVTLDGAFGRYMRQAGDR